MRKIALLLFVFSQALFAQDSESLTTKDSTEVKFEVLDEVPVYKGCDKNSGNAILKKCMSGRIAKHISKHFDLKVVKGLGLPDGLVRINVIFKVDHKGHVTGIRTRGPHPALEKEAYRVISLIPRMTKPAYQRGNPVTVPYAIPIMFNVDNSKFSKKRKH